MTRKNEFIAAAADLDAALKPDEITPVSDDPVAAFFGRSPDKEKDRSYYDEEEARSQIAMEITEAAERLVVNVNGKPTNEIAYYINVPGVSKPDCSITEQNRRRLRTKLVMAKCLEQGFTDVRIEASLVPDAARLMVGGEKVGYVGYCLDCCRLRYFFNGKGECGCGTGLMTVFDEAIPAERVKPDIREYARGINELFAKDYGIIPEEAKALMDRTLAEANAINPGLFSQARTERAEKLIRGHDFGPDVRKRLLEIGETLGTVACEAAVFVVKHACHYGPRLVESQPFKFPTSEVDGLTPDEIKELQRFSDRGLIVPDQESVTSSIRRAVDREIAKLSLPLERRIRNAAYGRGFEHGFIAAQVLLLFYKRVGECALACKEHPIVTDIEWVENRFHLCDLKQLVIWERLDEVRFRQHDGVVRETDWDAVHAKFGTRIEEALKDEPELKKFMQGEFDHGPQAAGDSVGYATRNALELKGVVKGTMTGRAYPSVNDGVKMSSMPIDKVQVFYDRLVSLEHELSYLDSGVQRDAIRNFLRGIVPKPYSTKLLDIFDKYGASGFQVAFAMMRNPVNSTMRDELMAEPMGERAKAELDLACRIGYAVEAAHNRRRDKASYYGQMYGSSRKAEDRVHRVRAIPSPVMVEIDLAGMEKGITEVIQPNYQIVSEEYATAIKELASKYLPEFHNTSLGAPYTTTRMESKKGAVAGLDEGSLMKALDLAGLKGVVIDQGTVSSEIPRLREDGVHPRPRRVFDEAVALAKAAVQLHHTTTLAIEDCVERCERVRNTFTRERDNHVRILTAAAAEIIAKTDVVPQFKEDGRCACYCATPCPLGKTGMSMRCTLKEYEAAMQANYPFTLAVLGESVMPRKDAEKGFDALKKINDRRPDIEFSEHSPGFGCWDIPCVAVRTLAEAEARFGRDKLDAALKAVGLTVIEHREDEVVLEHPQPPRGDLRTVEQFIRDGIKSAVASLEAEVPKLRAKRAVLELLDEHCRRRPDLANTPTVEAVRAGEPITSTTAYTLAGLFGTSEETWWRANDAYESAEEPPIPTESSGDTPKDGAEEGR